MYKGSHDLARRAIKYTMVGLSFREFLEMVLDVRLPVYSLDEILKKHEPITSEIIEKIEMKGEKILPLFQRYQSHGYYPYFFELNDKELYFITLEQNLHSTIEGDLAAIYPHLTGATISKLKQLLVFIAKSVPFIPNWNSIKEILEIGDVRTLKTYFQYLEDAALIRSVAKGTHKLATVAHAGKIYLDNPNQMQALCLGDHNVGTLRETFFLDMLSSKHQVNIAPFGDFFVDDKYVFEIGGKNKSFSQVSKEVNSFVVRDNEERGSGAKIPLWLFGFLY
ncbi:MAG: ATP-binding protein [Verrucomicrobia bacterium]|nr:ATP-binding protein [Verrucomicrobiota bacterium]